uniref:OSJNBa0085C10.23 protein n=1 Tax=Oryza sativa subsp. japonica TaxID=39947 RepID=Q5JPW8_ORYSJ|nr:OSJNBa0085C10.23 [Oryza sativa Japonica Group]
MGTGDTERTRTGQREERDPYHHAMRRGNDHDERERQEDDDNDDRGRRGGDKGQPAAAARRRGRCGTRRCDDDDGGGAVKRRAGEDERAAEGTSATMRMERPARATAFRRNRGAAGGEDNAATSIGVPVSHPDFCFRIYKII